MWSPLDNYKIKQKWYFRPSTQVISGLISVIISSFALVVSSGALKVSNKSVSISSKALETNITAFNNLNKPIIAVSFPKDQRALTEEVDDDKITLGIHFAIKNVGNVPALNITMLDSSSILFTNQVAKEHRRFNLPTDEATFLPVLPQRDDYKYIHVSLIIYSKDKEAYDFVKQGLKNYALEVSISLKYSDALNNVIEPIQISRRLAPNEKPIINQIGGNNTLVTYSDW